MFLPLPTPTEMTGWDAAAVALGLTEDTLMENAAREALAVLLRHVGRLRNKRVLLIMGGGNNGGDAACLARHLLDAGAVPHVLHTRPLSRLKGAARRYALLARRLGVPFTPILSDPDRILKNATPFFPAPPDIIVDGLLGTGFTGCLRPREAAVIQWINTLSGTTGTGTTGAGTTGGGFTVPVLALDVPSGLDAARGLPCPDAVRATVTVTFQAAKPGLILPHARPFTGLLEVRPIGIPRRVMEEKPASFRLWGCSVFASDADHDQETSHILPCDPALPLTIAARPRLSIPADVPCFASGPAHKGQAGRVLIVGGSAGLSGAAVLAAWGALRGGAGLLTVAAPHKVLTAVRAQLPEATTLALKRPEKDRNGLRQEWSQAHLELLGPCVARNRAVVVGPGMGQKGSASVVEGLLRLPDRPPLILDADALGVLAVRPDLLAQVRPDDVLTPHPGEAAALLGVNTTQVQADRFAALAGLHALTPAVWVLKGAGTLIAAPEQPVTICPWHVPCLAVGGSGDVLAGLVAAFVAGGQAPALAAPLAVCLHALAGLWLEQRFPLRGCSPRDIADALPVVRPLLGR